MLGNNGDYSALVGELAFTLHLVYENLSVCAVKGESRHLFSDPYKTHNTFCGQNVDFL
jgi:hypothetical protein